MINNDSIKALFINIFANIIQIKEVTYKKIRKVFEENHVFFDKPIDVRVPNKYKYI